ncbi:MAG: DUF6524 family protein [Candidatus Moraniibacteriota bacterium]
MENAKAVATKHGKAAGKGMLKFAFTSFFKSFKNQNFVEVLYTRLVYALVVVWATYNPTQYCLYKWVQTSDAAMSSKALAVGAAVIVWGIFAFLAKKALGTVGLIAMFGISGLATWFLIDHGYLDLTKASEAQWYTTFIISILFAVGMATGILIRRLSGQMSTDEVDNN